MRKKEPTETVLLSPAYPGASIYQIDSPTDHFDWVRAANCICKVSRAICRKDLDPWCGLVVAGYDRTLTTKGGLRPPESERHWHYLSGPAFLTLFSPHEEEHPNVYHRVQDACLRAVACTNLPHVLQYNVYLWIKPDTYPDLVQELGAALEKYNVKVAPPEDEPSED